MCGFEKENWKSDNFSLLYFVCYAESDKIAKMQLYDLSPQIYCQDRYN